MSYAKVCHCIHQLANEMESAWKLCFECFVSYSLFQFQKQIICTWKKLTLTLALSKTYSIHIITIHTKHTNYLQCIVRLKSELEKKNKNVKKESFLQIQMMMFVQYQRTSNEIGGVFIGLSNTNNGCNVWTIMDHSNRSRNTHEHTNLYKLEWPSLAWCKE